MAGEKDHFDVIIIGAGMSGLTAALELSGAGLRCAVLEASHRAGGRIHTMESALHYPVELGAEFVHGDLPRTKDLLQKAGIELIETEGEAYRKRNDGWVAADFADDYEALANKFATLEQDVPVATFLHEHFSAPGDARARDALQSYTEGYNAADISTASTFALRDDLEGSDDAQYRPKDGYKMLVLYLLRELEAAGVPIVYSAPVSAVDWQRGHVTIETANSRHWTSRQCLVTVSLGVLKSNTLAFSPVLQQQEAAWNSLGFGSVAKVVLHFRTPFWLDKRGMGAAPGFLLSSEEIPTWWTQLPSRVPLLTGWLGGPKSSGILQHSDDEITAIALRSLTRLFDVPMEVLEKELVASYLANWEKDPFVLGAYSFKTVDDNIHKKLLKTGVEDTLFFAGEALYEGGAGGTVEAALHCGGEVAQRMATLVKTMV